MQRRDFLRAAGVTSIAASFPTFADMRQPKRTHFPLGLELISVLTPMTVDLRQTLFKVAAIGYTEVETLGSLGRSPDELYETFAQCRLRSSSQHLVPDDLYGVYQQWDGGRLTLPEALVRLQQGYSLEKLDYIIEQGIARARTLHQQFLVWPVLFDDQVASREALEASVQAFNRAGELCRQCGMTFAFHNGSNASRRIDDASAYDLILQNTDPDTVKMELDTYYLAKSGASPSAYLAAHPNRYPLMHLKDLDARGEIADLGRGTIDFANLLSVARHAGVQHFFVEHDRAAAPLDSARTSFDFVRHL